MMTAREMDGGGWVAPETRDGAVATPLQIVLRRKWAVLAFAVAVAALVAWIVDQLPIRYAATASIMIDQRQLKVTDAQEVVSDPQLDFYLLRTGMEMLRSPTTARIVVEELGLTRVDEYCAAAANDGSSLLDRLLAWARSLRSSPPAPAACDIPVERAVEHLLTVVSSGNDGRSYLIKLEATAGTPELAAAIANSYARAYVARHGEGRAVAAQQADVWLTSYVEQLRERMRAADARVEAYQREHQLTELRGETVARQSLAELNSQLTVATSDLAQRQSMLREAETIASRGGRVDAITPVLDSPVIQKLLDRQAELNAIAADFRTKYGSKHPQVQTLAAQISGVRASLAGEVAKMVASIRADVAALSTRKAAIEARVQQLQADVGLQAQSDVRLQELRRDAETNHQLYRTMLTRLQQIDVESRTQWSGASVVVPAMVPKFPTYPRKKMIVVGSFLAALGLGGGLAVLRHLLTRTYDDVDQVERETGAQVIGLFPKPPRRHKPEDMVVDRPLSLETEALHSILIGLTGGQGELRPPLGRVVMVTSALPNEGKTSLSVALGRSAVGTGLNVALIDCDLRRPSVERLTQGGHPVASSLPYAPTRALDESVTLLESTALDVRSSLNVLTIRGKAPNPHRLLASPAFAAALDSLRLRHDLIILDTPPVLAVADALNLASLVDDALLLVQWRQTPKHAVQAAVQTLRRNNVGITGVVLTKVDLRAFARSNKAKGYRTKHYSGYHTDARALGAGT